MNTDRRDSIRDSLRRLVDAHAAHMAVLERTYTLLCEELAYDPQECLSRPIPVQPPADHPHPVIDRSRFTVTFRGRACRLGNTIGFRFLARLAETPEQTLNGSHILPSPRSVVYLLHTGYSRCRPGVVGTPARRQPSPRAPVNGPFGDQSRRRK